MRVLVFFIAPHLVGKYIKSLAPNRSPKQITGICSTWRIIPFSKWLVTLIYKPFRPFGRGITPFRGLTKWDDPPSTTTQLFPRLQTAFSFSYFPLSLDFLHRSISGGAAGPPLDQGSLPGDLGVCLSHRITILQGINI